ncbi:MAG: hypothetical protein KL840_05200 [Aquamicrobium sp.]|nr:hypothetical protein [Aquamicrobium sp.]
MNHFATADFWDCYQRLPAAVQRISDRNFERLKADPYHPSLHFKQAGRFWSARVGLQYRALAVRDGDDMIWFWIGTHADYDRLVG